MKILLGFLSLIILFLLIVVGFIMIRKEKRYEVTYGAGMLTLAVFWILIILLFYFFYPPEGW